MGAAAAAWRRAGRSGGRAGRRVSAPGRTTTDEVYIRTYREKGKREGGKGGGRREGDKNRRRHVPRMREGGNGGCRREGDKNREKRGDLLPPILYLPPGPTVIRRAGE